MRPSSLTPAILGALSLLAGCSVTAVAPTAADRNRERVLELENEIAALTRRNAELETALAAAQHAAPTRIDGAAVPADALAAAPLATTLRFGRFGGVIDGERDGRPDRVRIYLELLDGRDRAVQVAGRAVVEAILVDPAGGARSLGVVELNPAAWQDAFRTGFLGTHYSVEIPFTWSPELVGSVLVRATVDDAVTGRQLRAEQLYELPAQR